VRGLPPLLQALPRAELRRALEGLRDDCAAAAVTGALDSASLEGHDASRWRGAERLLMRWLAGRLMPGDDAYEALCDLLQSLPPTTDVER
jgi:hypothetical protein